MRVIFTFRFSNPPFINIRIIFNRFRIIPEFLTKFAQITIHIASGVIVIDRFPCEVSEISQLSDDNAERFLLLHYPHLLIDARVITEINKQIARLHKLQGRL